MDKEILDKSLENFFLNSNIQIDFGNFFIAIILSLINALTNLSAVFSNIDLFIVKLL